MLAKVSIILPVYNVASYIKECMNSLYTQTISNLEVIWVDDYGTDGSIALIEQFIADHKLHSTWHIIATPCNSGPSVARNLGIAHATGEYVLFVDADDWIEPQMAEQLYNRAIQFDADISSSAAILDFSNGAHKVLYNPPVGDGALSDKQRRYLLRHYVSNFTTMIFRRSWLIENEISFPNSSSGEDSSFMGQCYLMCRNISQIDQPLYHYRIHGNSISHQKRVYRGAQKRKAFHALIDFARTKGILSKYRWTLYWVYFKKAIVTSVLDYIASIAAK